MNIRDVKKYTVFTLVCFLSLINVTFAVSTIYYNQQISLEGMECDSNPPLSVSNTDTGANISYENPTGTNGSTVSITCRPKSGGSDAIYDFKLNNTKYEETNTFGTVVRAYSGPGTCSMGSGWSSHTYESNVGTRPYYDYKPEDGGSVTLGDVCTAASDVDGYEGILEFAGWINATGGGYQSIGTCEGASKNVTASAGQHYGACYKLTEYRVQIVFSGVTVSTSGWTASHTETDDYYHKASSADETVTLPSIAPGFGDEREYVWRSSKTGAEVSGGTAVKHDGTVWTAVPKGDGSSSEGPTEFKKSVYVNETAALITAGITTCNASNSYVKAQFVNGECQVTGLAVTGSGTYGDVFVEANGRTLTYKFSVESRQGNAQNGDDDFAINTSSAIIIGKNDEGTEKKDLMTDTCDNFNVYSLPDDNPNMFANDSNGSPMSSAVFGVTTGCGGEDTNDYVALCLDPGRKGPTSGSAYKKVNDIKSDSDFGKLILYIAQAVPLSEFTDAHSSERIAAHVAARVVAIKDGLSAAIDSSDLKYAAHYYAYNAIAAHLRTCSTSGDNDMYDEACVEEAVNKMTFNDNSVKTLVTRYLKEYRSVSGDSGHELKREILDTETEFINGTAGYKVKYKGTFTVPTTNESSIHFEECSSPGTVGMTSCTIDKWERNDELTNEKPGSIVFDYEVTLTANDGSIVKPPKTKDEQKAVSFKLTFAGNNSVDNIFLAEPATGDILQRMLIFNVNASNSTVYVYFSVAPGTEACDTLDTLKKSSECTSDDSCPSDFNKELFKVTGCCRFVTDETSYLFQNVCNGNCTVSTLVTVCAYDPADLEGVDTYYISEGKAHDDSNPQGSDNLGECVVNVSNPDFVGSDPAEFEFTDDNGNPISDKNYSGNRYCRINCKEDWEMKMSGFGNLVGENAAAAGTYFTDGNSVFISAARTCYTNYIDYIGFNESVVELSNIIIEQYNEYSINSHIYTDIKRQKDNEYERHISGSGSRGCLKYKSSCPDSYSWDGSDCSKEECDDEGNCETVTTALECEYYGTAISYELTVEGEVEEGTDKEYDANIFDSDLQITPEEAGDMKSVYPSDSRATEKLTCTITEKYEPSGEATYECSGPNGISDKPACPSYATGSFSNSDLYKVCADGASAGDEAKNDGTDGKGLKYAFEALHKGMMDARKNDLEAAKRKLAQAHNTIYQYNRNMYDCQHFQLFNNSDGDKGISCQVKITEETLGENRDYVKIDTDFDPSVSYTYDEDGFMTILDRDNVLVEYYEKNDEAFANPKNTNESKIGQGQTNSTSNDPSSGYKNACGIQVTWDDPGSSETTTTIGGGSPTTTVEPPTEEVTISHDYIDSSYYNPSSAWATDSTYGKTYGDIVEVTPGSTESGTVPGPDVIEPSNSDFIQKKKITFCTINGKSTGGGGNPIYVSGKEGSGYTVFGSGGTATPEWHGGSCYKVELTYIYAHYIKSSMENGSYYKTKGAWYIRTSDIKEHGDNLEGALNNADSRSDGLNYSGGGPWGGGSTTVTTPGSGTVTEGTTGSATVDVIPGGSPDGTGDGGSTYEWDYWALLGTGYNVFPVSLNTPRNLYQYTYYFGDMGSYDDGESGRIMGREDSIITMNKRTCFYEVYEDICLCCGDEINTHVEEEDFTLTQQFVDETGVYELSDVDKMELNEDGTISFSTSSISLNDLDSDSGRSLGSNWSTGNPIYIDGKNYTTDKGATLKSIIEEKGETVYDLTESGGNYKGSIEYRFTLTPETMQRIREYNDAHGYDINYNTLKVYGRYTNKSIDGGTSDSSFIAPTADEMYNKYSTFSHLGSNFLETVLPSYGANVVDPKSLSNLDQVCQVVDTELGSDKANKIKEKVNSGCRWIDYIDTSNAGDKLRLAFK